MRRPNVPAPILLPLFQSSDFAVVACEMVSLPEHGHDVPMLLAAPSVASAGGRHWDVKTEQNNMVRIHASVLGFKSIWRRLEIPCGFDLFWLHMVMEIAFGRAHSDDCIFWIGGLIYVYPATLSRTFRGRVFDATEIRLGDFVAGGEKAALSYTNFSVDGHRTYRIKLEKMLTVAPAPYFASCVDGKRALPPDFVANDEQYQDFLAQCRGSSSPDAIDIQEINRALKRLVQSS
jgi:Plasmid pRiA4b ORF-3-like protein